MIICIPLPSNLCHSHLSIGPRRFNLIGISSKDNKVYLWQKEDGTGPFNSSLYLWRVNPVVPSSWQRFKTIKMSGIYTLAAAMSLDCNIILLRIEYNMTGNGVFTNMAEFLVLNLDNSQINTFRATAGLQATINERTYHSRITKIAETSVGWVGWEGDPNSFYFNTPFWKIFPDAKTPQFLTLAKQCSGKELAVSKNNLFHIRKGSDDGLLLNNLIGYDLNHKNTLETPLGQLLAGSIEHRMLIGSPESTYLARFDPVFKVTQIFKIVSEGFHFRLVLIVRIPEFWYVNAQKLTAGNEKIASVFNNSLAVVSLSVPSLKFLATWAVQNLFGRIGTEGELLGGITEEQCRRFLGYKSAKPIFFS